MSDEVIDPTLLEGVITDDIEKLHQCMHRIARKAFCEHNAKSTYKKALRSRPRVWTDYKPGEYAYVFRTPKVKKRKHGAPPEEADLSTKARWIGPGIVITPDGANLCVAMLGELWKVAREQCRPDTTDERTGIEVVLNKCRELVEEFRHGSHRAGYKDITQEEFPPEAEDEGEERLRPEDQRRRVGFQLEPREMADYEPEYPEGMIDQEPEEPPKRRRSMIEPEQEEVPSSDPEEKEQNELFNPAFPEGVTETPPRPEGPPLPGEHPDPVTRQAMRDSIAQADWLDDVPRQPFGTYLPMATEEWATRPFGSVHGG